MNKEYNINSKNVAKNKESEKEATQTQDSSFFIPHSSFRTVLTIAGSDTSAGAGIQQDLKTITSLGHYAVTVPTALTAQNTVGVQKVMTVPEDMLEAQLQSVFSDINVEAIKIGMIPCVESARIIVKFIKQFGLPTVCDPVMISTSGTQLMSDECVEYIKKELFPLCTLVTPNIPEALRLSNTEGEYDLEKTGHALVKEYNAAFLLKGGHGEGSVMRDVLFTIDGTTHEYCSPRITTTNLHGTGCTLSSAIATGLATRLSLPEAVKVGKAVIDKGIKGGRNLHIGKGNGPLWLF